jgi:hypothetical protein
MRQTKITDSHVRSRRPQPPPEPQFHLNGFHFNQSCLETFRNNLEALKEECSFYQRALEQKSSLELGRWYWNGASLYAHEWLQVRDYLIKEQLCQTLTENLFGSLFSKERELWKDELMNLDLSSIQRLRFSHGL